MGFALLVRRMRVLGVRIGAGVLAVGAPLHRDSRKGIGVRLLQCDVLPRYVADLITADVAVLDEEGAGFVHDDAGDRPFAVGHLLEPVVASVVGHQVDHVAVTVEYDRRVVHVVVVDVVDVHGHEALGTDSHLAAFERHEGVDVGVGQLVDETAFDGHLFGCSRRFGDDVVLRHALEHVSLGVAPLGQRQPFAPEFEFVVAAQVVLAGVGRDEGDTQRGVGVLQIGRAVVEGHVGFGRGLRHRTSGHVGRGVVAYDRAAHGDVAVDRDLAFGLRDQTAQVGERHLAGVARAARNALPDRAAG